MWRTFLKQVADFLTALSTNIVANKIRYVSFWFWKTIFRIKGNIPDDNPEEAKNLPYDDKLKLLRGLRTVRLVRCYWGFFILALTVAGVEKIIGYNDLSPQNNLSQPGQMIPFVLGIITIIEGVANACMPKPRPGKNNSMSDNSRRDFDRRCYT